MTVTLQSIEDARSRIAPYITETPLIRMHALDAILGCRVHLKMENMQRTHAFKIRGAMNRVLKLTDQERENGIIAASSGNHGKAIAHAAKSLGIRATIVVPDTASEFKVGAIRDLGADIVRCDVSERFTMSNDLAETHGYTPIHPYDDADIISGQGTVGLEIMEQCAGIDTIIVPTSGGGLLGGILTAVKSIDSNVRVLGAEPARLPRYSESLAQGKLVKIKSRTTIADALVTDQPGALNFPIVQSLVDGMLTVEDAAIQKAMKSLATEGKIIAEPSSCIGMAAVMAEAYTPEPEEDVCFVLSGGNLSLDQFSSLVDAVK